MESSQNLINNLLLNLDNLQIQTENNENNQNVNDNLQEQLELLKSETEKLTNQYTRNTNKKKLKSYHHQFLLVNFLNSKLLMIC